MIFTTLISLVILLLFSAYLIHLFLQREARKVEIVTEPKESMALLGGETAVLRISVRNAGSVPLGPLTLRVFGDSMVRADTRITVESLPVGKEYSLEVPVTAEEYASGQHVLTVSVEGSGLPKVVKNVVVYVNKPPRLQWNMEFAVPLSDDPIHIRGYVENVGDTTAKGVEVYLEVPSGLVPRSSKVFLGDIRPGERKTVEFFLDKEKRGVYSVSLCARGSNIKDCTSLVLTVP